MVLRIIGLIGLFISVYTGVYVFFGLVTTLVVVGVMSFISIMTVALAQRHTSLYAQKATRRQWLNSNTYPNDRYGYDSMEEHTPTMFEDPAYSNMEGNIYHSSLDD